LEAKKKKKERKRRGKKRSVEVGKGEGVVGLSVAANELDWHD